MRCNIVSTLNEFSATTVQARRVCPRPSPSPTPASAAKYMDVACSVCPVDCFYEGETMLVIHPVEAIHAACASRNARPTRSCPTRRRGAAPWLELNARLAAVWPNITRKGTPPADADAWKGVPGKLAYLRKAPAADAGLPAPLSPFRNAFPSDEPSHEPISTRSASSASTTGPTPCSASGRRATRRSASATASSP